MENQERSISTLFLLASALAVISFSQNLFAAYTASNKGISFQAVIKDPSGSPISISSPTTVNAKILTPNNCILWDENHTATISNGYLFIYLGQGTSGGSHHPATAKFNNIFDNSAVFSGLECIDTNGGITPGGTYNPLAASADQKRKVRISFVFGADTIETDFNLRTMAYAERAENAQALRGKTETDFIQTSTTVTQSAVESWFTSSLMTQILGGNYNAPTATLANSATTAGNVTGIVGIANGGTGASTAANARTNLGLGALATVTPTGTADGTKFLRDDGSWQSVSGGGGSAPSGAASGDLSGSYPNPTVSQIKGQSISTTGSSIGQVLRYAGANTWTPHFISMFDLRSTVTGAQAFDGAGCTAGQTLTWTAATDNLSCTSIAVADSQVTFTSKTANTFLAAPNGSGGAPTFRTIASADLPAGIATAGTYKSVTVDTYGRVTAGTNPTTLSGYGITDAVSSTTGFVDGGNSFGAAATLGTADNYNLGFKTNGSARMTIDSSGNVGIGTAAPDTALDVNGTIKGKAAVSNGTVTIDFSTGNLQYTTSDCTAFQLNNMKDGASYTFAIKGTVSSTCSFTAFSDVGSTALTVHLPQDHTASTTGLHTIYTFVVMGSDVYSAWTQQ